MTDIYVAYGVLFVVLLVGTVIRLFRKPDPSSDWVIVRMRAVTQQIGPRYKSGLFTQYTEASNG